MAGKREGTGNILPERRVMRTQRLWLYLLLAAAVIYHGLIVYHIFFSRLWMTDMLSGNLWGGEGGRVISGGTRDMGLFGQDDLSRGNPLQPGDVVVRLLPEKPAGPGSGLSMAGQGPATSKRPAS